MTNVPKKQVKQENHGEGGEEPGPGPGLGPVPYEPCFGLTLNNKFQNNKQDTFHAKKNFF